MDGYSPLKTAIVGIIIASCVWAFAFIMIVVCWHVSANDNAKIQRDRVIKTTCIEQGKQLIAGNCIVAPK